MDLDKPSVWGSLKQKTRPFLQNLSVKRTKKRSSKIVERRVHSLDRRLSVSVPDMLEVEALTEEEMTYSSTQVLSSCSPKSFSRSVVSLKSRSASVRPVGEDWPWASQQATRTEVTVAHLDAQVAGSPVSQQKRKSSDNLFDLLQSARLSAALTDEGVEVGGFGHQPRLSACLGLVVFLLNCLGYKGRRRGPYWRNEWGIKISMNRTWYTNYWRRIQVAFLSVWSFKITLLHFFFIYSDKVIILQFFWICWNCFLKSKVVAALWALKCAAAIHLLWLSFLVNIAYQDCYIAKSICHLAMQDPDEGKRWKMMVSEVNSASTWN